MRRAENSLNFDSVWADNHTFNSCDHNDVSLLNKVDYRELRVERKGTGERVGQRGALQGTDESLWMIHESHEFSMSLSLWRERETLNWWCCSITRLKNGTARWMHGDRSFREQLTISVSRENQSPSSSSSPFFFLLLLKWCGGREATLLLFNTLSFSRRRSLQQQRQQWQRQCLQSLITDWGNDRGARGDDCWLAGDRPVQLCLPTLYPPLAWPATAAAAAVTAASPSWEIVQKLPVRVASPSSLIWSRLVSSWMRWRRGCCL